MLWIICEVVNQSVKMRLFYVFYKQYNPCVSCDITIYNHCHFSWRMKIFSFILIIDCINTQNTYTYSTSSASSKPYASCCFVVMLAIHLWDNSKVYISSKYCWFFFFLKIPSGFVHTDLMCHRLNFTLVKFTIFCH